MLEMLINKMQINEINKFMKSDIGYPLCVMKANDEIVISFIDKTDNRMNFYYVNNNETYIDIFNKYDYKELDIIIDFNELILNVYDDVYNYYSFINSNNDNIYNKNNYEETSDMSLAINEWTNKDVTPYLDKYDIDCIKQYNDGKYIIDVVQYIHDFAMGDKFKFNRFTSLSKVLMSI